MRPTIRNRTARLQDATAPYSSNPTSRTVYVGNLSWEVSWQDLKDHMKQAGHVIHADILEDSNHKSKGCGIVEYSTAQEAQNAITTLHDTDLNGRLMFVREDRESGGKPTKPQEKIFKSALTAATSSKVYVGNLAWETQWYQLKDHMKPAGYVVRADILLEMDGRSKGCGIVEFARVEEASLAIATLNDSTLHGRLIFVREDRDLNSSHNTHNNSHNNNSVQSVAVARVPGGPGDSSFGSHREVFYAPPPTSQDFGSNGFMKYFGQPPLQHHQQSQQSRSQNNACRRLYVGNLSWDVTWQMLKDCFKQQADVARAVIIADEAGRSRGFGLVEFFEAGDAAAAMTRFNNTMLQGRQMHVREDRESDRPLV